MKQLFLFLILAICLSCSDGNSGLPPSKEDSPIAVKTNDSVVADVAARLANPLLIVARSVYAGNDINATTSKITLSGSSNVNNNTWSQKSGPNQAVFSSKIDLKATVSNLINGKYWFILSGDYRGRKYRDSVKVLVSLASNVPPPVKNKIPVVSAGPDVTITLPTSIVTLNGSANDSDGKIVSSSWKGNAGTILTPPNLSTQITGLAAGRYTYTFTATDDSSASASDQVIVTVNAPIVIPPVDTVPTTPPPTTTGPNPEPTTAPFMTSGFEVAPVTNGFNSYYESPNTTDIVISTLEAHSGISSARFHLNQNDVQKTGHKRAELTLLPDSRRPYKNEPAITEGSERWVRFWFKIPTSFVNDREESIFQQHHDGSTGSPPCALYLTNGNYGWDYIRTFNGDEKVATITPYKKGVWQQITMHFKFSSTSSGLSEVWIDGFYYPNPGANLFPNQTNYTKVGIYAWIMTLSPGMNNTDQVFYYDDFAYWVIK